MHSTTPRARFIGSVLIALCGCFGTAAMAQVVPLYGRFEKSFAVDAGSPAFAEFAVRFIAPSGKVTVQEGFFDGGQVYRVRFMPTEEGPWKFETIAQAKGLAGQSGAFEVKRSENAAQRFLRHGPVRVSKEGTHLEHLDGTPLLFLGDTVWNGPLLAKKDHWDVFLADRAGKRFSAIQFVMCSPWRTAPTNAEGQVAYTGAKEITIHPEFYQRMDQRMDAIESAGMLSVPVLLWAWGKKDAGQALPEEDAIKLIRYQLARYAGHHVLWILNGDGKYEGEVAERWKRIGQAVFKAKLEQAGAYRQPVTLHPGGQQWPYANFRDEKWLDAYGYQSGHTNSPGGLKWAHSGPVSKEWKQLPARPYLNLEPCYEAHISGFTKKPFTAHDVRRACYWTLLAAPVAGLTYGGHGIWSWQEVDGLPFDHPYTGMAKRWQEAKDLPGASDMKRMVEFFESIAWTKLRPDAALLKEQPGAADPAKFAAAARSEAGDLAVVYMPAGGTIAIQAGAIKKDLKAQWFDPRTGQRQAATAGPDGAYAAPNGEDWVLVLQ